MKTLRSDGGVLGQATIGGPSTAALGPGPLRLLSVPARTAPAVLGLTAAGDVQSGVLSVADIPAAFTRRDVAETISQPWTWAAPATVNFQPTGAAVPSIPTRSIGTRVVLYPKVPTDTDYAIGIEDGGLWATVPAMARHVWYTSTVPRMELAADGSLELKNGVGRVKLASTDGWQYLEGTNNLIVQAQGTLYLGSVGTFCLPQHPYRLNLGAITQKFLTLHCAELWAETLVAQETLATIGGRILVGPTTTLTRNVAPADTTIYVKHNFFQLQTAGIEGGSKLVLQSNGRLEVMIVTSEAPPVVTAQGDFPYTVIRDADGSGVNEWYAGDALFDTGKYNGAGGSFIDLYSVRALQAGSTAGPTIAGNVRTGPNPFDWRERWAIGNLQGLYGYGTPVFGAAFGDPLSTRMLIDTVNGVQMYNAANKRTGHWTMDGSVMFGPPDGGRLMFDAVTGNLKLMMGGTDRIILQTDGNAYLASSLVCGALGGRTGTVRSVNTGPGPLGSGFYFSDTDGYTQALIGNATGNSIRWTGSDLWIKTAAVSIDPVNGITITGSSASEPSRWLKWDLPVADAFIGGFGSATGSTLQLQVSDAGTNFNYLMSLQAAPGLSLTLQKNAGGALPVLTLQSLGGYVNVQAGELQCESHLTNKTDLTYQIGTPDRLWRTYWGYYVKLGLRDTPLIALLELSANSAVKPVSELWTVASDARVKHDIEDVDGGAAIDAVRDTKIVRFTYTGACSTPAGERGIGVVADQAASVLPDSVTRLEDGMLYWNGHELFMLTIRAVQALAERLEALEAKGER